MDGLLALLGRALRDALAERTAPPQLREPPPTTRRSRPAAPTLSGPVPFVAGAPMPNPELDPSSAGTPRGPQGLPGPFAEPVRSREAGLVSALFATPQSLVAAFIVSEVLAKPVALRDQ